MTYEEIYDDILMLLPATLRKISESVHLSRITTRNRVEELIQRGVVVRVDPAPGAPRGIVYMLVGAAPCEYVAQGEPLVTKQSILDAADELTTGLFGRAGGVDLTNPDTHTHNGQIRTVWATL